MRVCRIFFFMKREEDFEYVPSITFFLHLLNSDPTLAQKWFELWTRFIS